MRVDGRENNEMRELKFLKDIQRDPDGSVQIHFGHTIVLCAATISSKVPPWLAGKGKGWVTAEYSMLPGSSGGRIRRKKSGRSTEIERLIGRSLRAAIDLELLGERMITVDCDVIQADGGTRTASISGGYLALALAIDKLIKSGEIVKNPLIHQIASISCGIVKGQAMVDLNYSEDSTAEVDMNFVIDENGDFVELQGTAEGANFDGEELNQMIQLAQKVTREIMNSQNKILSPN
jgi:ribonuclease PH